MAERPLRLGSDAIITAQSATEAISRFNGPLFRYQVLPDITLRAPMIWSMFGEEEIRAS